MFLFHPINVYFKCMSLPTDAGGKGEKDEADVSESCAQILQSFWTFRWLRERFCCTASGSAPEHGARCPHGDALLEWQWGWNGKKIYMQNIDVQTIYMHRHVSRWECQQHRLPSSIFTRWPLNHFCDLCVLLTRGGKIVVSPRKIPISVVLPSSIKTQTKP